MPWLLILVSLIFPARAEDVFDAAQNYIDLAQPFYSSYEKSRTTLGVAMIAQVSVEAASDDARVEISIHRPLLRDAFQRVLSRQTRASFTTAQGWEKLSRDALEEFNKTLQRQGCTNCVAGVLFPAGIVPEG